MCTVHEMGEYVQIQFGYTDLRNVAWFGTYLDDVQLKSRKGKLSMCHRPTESRAEAVCLTEARVL